jgi:UDP-3-O-[3-hydroxymyristoyl] glucosamine N-acyltransferase
MPQPLAQLAEAIGATLRGDGSVTVESCATLADAQPDQLSFLANPRYAEQIADTAAAAIVVSPADARSIPDHNLLIAEDPYYAFRQAMVLLHGFRPRPEPGIHPLACIDASATIGQDCHIGPFVHVGPHASVGDRTVLHSHVAIGRDARVGDDCMIYPHVTIYDRCRLGHRVTLHAGCSIGQDGFGYATHQADGDAAPVHHKIPQTGIAVIGDDCELGANCSVDRATMGATFVAAGTKFSNSVTIGHGSKVGRHNLFVALVGLAGSVTTGDYVALGGQVGVAGHLSIGDRARVAATSGVMHSIPPDGKWGGAPAQPLKQAFRTHAYLQQLPDLAATIRKLERRISKLESLQKSEAHAESP